MLTVLTGRSRRLWPRVLDEIGAAHGQGAKRLLLITPDQYTLQAELDLVDRLHLPGLLTIEVLSPSRLLTRVFSLAGSPQRVRVDARGKSMLMADVVRASRAALGYYAGAADRRGFAEEAAASIADCKRAGLSAGQLAEMADALEAGDALRGKLADIALLYARYEARLSGLFIDGEDAQEALLSRLPDSGLLKDAQVWIYGFDLLAPQFIRQIVVMARWADSVRVALTCENKARDAAVFAPVRDAIGMLGRQMREAGLDWKQETVAAPLGAHDEIRHLEGQLFAVKPDKWPDVPQAIHLAVAANPYDETARTAAEILRFARAGVPFDAMAVVVGDVQGYVGAIASSFGRSGIPYHITRARPALSHPLIRGWLTAIRLVTTQWRRQEDALDWLKSGFSGLTIEEAEPLENYAIEHGLRGRKWQKEIDDPALEALRQRYVQPLQALQARLRAARTNTESLAAVYQLLEDAGAHGTLCAWQATLTARGLLTEAAECAQAWNLLLETLDQLHALLHGSRMPMDGMAQVIESGFAAAQLGAVPPSPDVVQVDQLGHAKIGEGCRVLFLLGMQDGVLAAQATSLISDAEAARITQAGDTRGAFGMRSDTLAQLKQVNLLDTVSAPSEQLFVSHCAMSASGETLRPAAVLSLLRQVFPDLPKEGSVLAQDVHVSHAAGAALDALGPMLRAASPQRLPPEAMQTASWLLHAPHTRAHAQRVVQALAAPPPAERLGQGVAETIYAHTRTSVSRLETFASCPFRHFVAYGLRPYIRKDFQVARSETGTFFHRAMEGYALETAQLPAWPHLTREENDRIMDGVLAPLRAEWADQPLGDNAMMHAAGEGFCRVARRAAWTYAGQIRHGQFRTGQIEARFGPGEPLPPLRLLLPSGEVCHVEGRIDRIDFYQEDAQKWLRVVDYKSGSTTLDPSRMYGGLQLQLLLYLSAALAAYPDLTPAGAFYSRFDDPFVETDSRDVEQVEALIAEKLRLRGITLRDVRIVQAMDDSGRLITTRGEVKSSADVLSLDEMQALMLHAYTLAGQFASQIAGGEISAAPARLGTWRACAWCEYHSICGFDPAKDGHAVRPLQRLTKKEMLQRLAPQQGEAGEDI